MAYSSSGFEAMPTELIILISTSLPMQDINSLLQSSRRFAHVLTQVLYQRCVIIDGGWSVIEWAASEDHLPALKLMRDIYGINLNAIREPEGSWSALHLAALYDHPKIVEYLLDVCKFEVNTTTPCRDEKKPNRADVVYGSFGETYYEATALHMAAFAGGTASMKLLINYGAKIDAYASRFFTEELEDPDTDDDYWGPSGEHDLEPLHIAAEYGNPACVELLLDNGANVDAGLDNNLDQSPLAFAVRASNFDIVTVLLERNATANEWDASGATMLQIAAENGDLEIVKCLFKYGATVTDDTGSDNGLAEAGRHGHRDIMQLFLDLGADRKVLQEPGSLYDPVVNKKYNILRFYVELGADINSINKWSKGTALACAAQRYCQCREKGEKADYKRCIVTLLELGADWATEIATAVGKGDHEIAAAIEKFAHRNHQQN